VLALVAFGDDSWRNKPYSEWTDKEVREVLEKSPWAHRILLMIVQPDTQNPACPSSGQDCSPDAALSTSSSPVPRKRQATQNDPQDPQTHRVATLLPSGSEGVAATAVVRWASARTVREAVAKNELQLGHVKPEELQDPRVFAPLDAYVVYVDLRVALSDVKKVPQTRLFTAAMAQRSVLLFKNTGARISPLKVKAAPLPEFDERKEVAIAAFYVFFPRQRNGKPVLSANESLVRFECPTVPRAIAADFELRKMERAGSPDL
jgi:hypothetical protein